MKRKVIAAILAGTMVCASVTGCGKAEVKSDAQYEMLDAEEELLKTAVTHVVNSGNVDADKEETVYVKTSANGDIDSVIVSNWLKNVEQKETITDESGLQDIKNVKGKETYTKDGNAIVWNAEGEDIYYQGTTDKALPVEVNISYDLNGQPISPEELAGKSGQVTIHFDYTNHEKKEVEIGGEMQTIYTPFAAVSGMMLDNDKFKNVQVKNGTIINDANHAIVVGMAFPGLVDSLNGGEVKPEILDKIEEQLEIPSSVEVTADVDDFALGMTMTVISSDIMNSLGLDEIDTKDSDIDEIKSSIEEFQNAGNQLVDGTASLKDGAKSLKDGTSGLVDGTGALYDGVKKYTDGVGAVADGASALDRGAADLKNGTEQLNDGALTLKNGTEKLAQGADSVKDGAAKVNKGADELKTGAGALNEGAEKLKTGAATVYEGSKQLSDNLEKADAGAKSLVSGADQLAAGAKSVADGTALLESQAGGIVTSIQDIQAGVVSAKGGASATDQYVKAALEVAQGLAGSGTLSDDELAAIGSIIEKLTYADNYAAAVESGLGQMDSSISEKSASVQALVDGTKALNSGAATVSQGSASLAEGVKTVSAGVTAIYEGSKTLAGGTKEVSDGATTLAAGTKSLSDGATALASGTKELADGTVTLAKGSGELVSGAGELAKGAGKLNDGAGQLKDGTGNLLSGTKELNSNSGSLVDGAKELSDGSKELVDGIGQLFDGTVKLHDGMVEFDEKGIKELTKVLDVDVNSLENRMVAIADASKEYRTFSGACSDVDSRVKFILESAAIK